MDASLTSRDRGHHLLREEARRLAGVAAEESAINGMAPDALQLSQLAHGLLPADSVAGAVLRPTLPGRAPLNVASSRGLPALCRLPVLPPAFLL